MLGVSMDSLWTPDHYVMDGDPGIRNQKIRIFEISKNALGRFFNFYESSGI